MNERIQELAKQAGAHWNHGDFNMGCSVEFQEGDLDKFAELIVRECVSIAREEEGHSPFEGPVETKIKQHFGVE